MSFLEILVAIRDHHKHSPSHDINCACMDQYISWVRNMTKISDADIQARIDYVILAAVEGR